MGEAVLSVDNLSIGFKSEGNITTITEDIHFDLMKGEVFGLVGESGCGKSVSASAILGLLPQPGGIVLGGSISFQGKNILELGTTEMESIRGREISMIFQEPSSALNPLLTVKKQIMECFEFHPSEKGGEERVRELLVKVGLTDTDRVLSSYPHELSGGMLQRVMIAIALILKPKIIIADEPTTALDVTIQAQIMELLTALKTEMETSVLLITHNLGLIAQYADRLAVMYAGRIVEECVVEDFLHQARHPYTRGLIRAIPDIYAEKESLIPIPGQVPQPVDYTTGCRFADRCTYATEECKAKPELTELAPSHRVACFNPQDSHGG